MSKTMISLIKELRELTGAGLTECKKTLLGVNGNIELAIESMRKSGAIKAAEKSGNFSVKNGLITVKIKENYGAILEINCQTDFAARSLIFKEFSDKVLELAISKRITNIEILKAQFEEERIALISRIGENINIRRIGVLNDDTLGFYLHNSRIGVLISTRGAEKNLIKQLAMHIAASKPKFVNQENIPNEIIEREQKIQLEIAMRLNQSKDIIRKIVENRMKKFIEEIVLINQPFVMEPSKLISQLLKENNADVHDFIRFEIGENIKNNNVF